MEYVIKRDGTKVPFDKSKIVNAIEKAMTNTTGGVDSRVSNAIAAVSYTHLDVYKRQRSSHYQQEQL